MALALLIKDINIKKLFLPLCMMILPMATLAETMCNISDRVIFSCEIGRKSVSACLGQDGQVSYIYGSKDNSEIELHSPVLSTAACSGGGISRLRFVNGTYSYIVYDAMCNAKQIGPDQWSKGDYAGVLVLNGDEVISNKLCTDFSADIFGVNTGLLPDTATEEFNYDLP